MARRAAFVDMRVLVALAPAWCLMSGAAPLSGQASAGTAYDHTCADCHMRDHTFEAGPGGVQESNLAVRAITSMIPGLSVQSANCLECHGTPEQRTRRNARGAEGALPVGGGLYLGFMTRNGHPLGRERRAADWAARTGGVSPFRPPASGTPLSDRLDPMVAEVDCSDCHAPHAYDLTVGATADERSVCLECHDPAYYAFQAHVTPSCGDCHRQHGARGPALTAEPDLDGLCAACHEGTGWAPLTPVARSLHGPPTHIDLRPGRCSDCHKIHGDPGGR